MTSKNIIFSAMKEVLPLLIMMCACVDPAADIKSAKYYQIAIESLRKDNITRTALLSNEEMKWQKCIAFGKDTVYLVQSELLFCLLDRKTHDIYVFKFFTNYGFRRYTCNSHWKVLSELEQTGEGILPPNTAIK